MIQVGIDFNAIKKTLISYIKNPVVAMKNIPHWDWKTLITLQLLTSLISGVLASLININIWGLLQGIIIIPIVSLVTAGVTSLFLYYSFLFLSQRSLSHKELLTIVILSNIPFFFLQTLSTHFSPYLSLIGVLCSAFLLIVGLVEHYQLPRPLVIKVVVSIWFIYLIIWGLGQIESYQLGHRF